jgi:hypothetical protein
MSRQVSLGVLPIRVCAKSLVFLPLWRKMPNRHGIVKNTVGYEVPRQTEAVSLPQPIPLETSAVPLSVGSRGSSATLFCKSFAANDTASAAQWPDGREDPCSALISPENPIYGQNQGCMVNSVSLKISRRLLVSLRYCLFCGTAREVVELIFGLGNPSIRYGSTRLR